MTSPHAASRLRHSAKPPASGLRGSRSCRAAVAALAFVLVLAACGDDDDAADTTDAGTGAGSDAGELECTTAASGEPVKVGVVWPEGATIAVPELEDSARAAAAYGNDCLGGIGGRPIEFMGCTIDEANAATATECANQAVEGGVDAFVVTISGLGSSLVPVITGAGIPYIAFGGVAPQENVDQTGLVFSVTGGLASVLGGYAQVAKDEGFQKVALVVTDNAASTVGALASIPFGAAGVPVETISIPAGTPDATPQVSAALSSGADVLAMLGDATLCISFLQAVAAVDPDGEHWFASTCVAPAVLEAAGEGTAEGGRVFINAFGEGDDPESVLYRQVMAEYAPGVPTAGFTAAGYVAMLGFIRGVADGGVTGEVTAESIAAAMASSSDVPQPAGFGATFGCATDPIPVLNALCGSDVIVSVVRDGRETDTALVETAALFGGG